MLNIHPALLSLMEVVNEEMITNPDIPLQIIQRLTIRIPTLEQYHERYDSHFFYLRENGDKWANQKEKSFYDAVQKDFEALNLGPDRTVVHDTPFFEI